MRSRPARNDNQSLKTFLVYTAIVLFFIFLSLLVRAFYLVQQSKYDGKHQIVIALGQDDKVKEIISLRPSDQSVTTFQLKGEDLRFSALGKTLGILPDAIVKTGGEIAFDGDTRDTLQAMMQHYYSIKTNLTVFDVVRLFIDSRKASLSTPTTKEIIVAKEDENTSGQMKNLLTDSAIFSENMSVQIINASSTPGLGKRLEKVLTGLGANIVAISTSRNVEKSSKIQYFGNETYTLHKVKSLLHFPTEKLEKEAIADIIIIIGDEKSNLEKF